VYPTTEEHVLVRVDTEFPGVRAHVARIAHITRIEHIAWITNVARVPWGKRHFTRITRRH
jgi:hypothetical protein